ncbi:MAG: MEDS domain-containing protein [Gaiellaceae bacterium]
MPGFRHEAFLYDSHDEFVGKMAAFLGAGLEEGASGLAVTTRSRSALLRDALGPESERIRFIDRDDWFVRPATTVGAYHATLTDLARKGAASIRVVGEIQFGPTAEEWREWTSYEAILNRAFGEHAVWFICPTTCARCPTR